MLSPEACVLLQILAQCVWGRVREGWDPKLILNKEVSKPGESLRD